MGKYMRKAKISADVAVMEVSQATLGVRTRARTLALQRLQSSPPPSSSSARAGAPPAPASSGKAASSDSSGYLQLRSRRLEKPPSLKPRGEKTSCRNAYPQSKSEMKANPSFENSGSNTRGRKEVGFCGSSRLAGETGPEKDVGDEGSFGENTPGFEHKERGTRESTPCSSIRAVDVAPPGSSTRQREDSSRNEGNRSVDLESIPSQAELDEFFARENQQKFIEKYNFDIINDVPLPGRYEWVRVVP